MDNLEIKRNQLRQRDALRDVQQTKKAIEKLKQELEQLQVQLSDYEHVLVELDMLLEGKVYINNT